MDNRKDVEAFTESNYIEIQSMARDQDTIDLLDYFEHIANNWKLITTVSAVAAVIALLISLRLPNIYSARALILSPQQNSSLVGMLMGANSGMGSVASDFLGKGSLAEMYIGIMKSDVISDSIIDRFKLMKVYNKEYRIDTYSSLNKNVDFTAGKKDGIVTITVEDIDPNRAAAMANAYVDELTKLLIKLNSTDANKNKTYFEERLDKTKQDLVNAENALKIFQSKNRTFDISEQAKSTLKGVADLEAQLAIEEIKLTGMRRIYTDTSQEIKNQNSVINGLKSQIIKFETSKTNRVVPGIDTVPALGQQYFRLMRDFKTKEALFELLTKQYEMAALDEAKDVAGLQVIQYARVPDRKIKPKRKLLILLSTFAAAFICTIYVFIREKVLHMPDEQKERLHKILTKFTLK